MAEVAPSGNGGGVNRTFLLIIGGLAGLLILGLVAAGVLLFLPSLLGGGKTPVAATSITPTKVALQPATAPRPSQTPVSTATLVVAAAVTPTSPTFITATPVTSGGITSPGGAGAPSTPATGGETSKGGVATGGELPSSGLGENLLLLAAGLALIAIMFVARRVRGTG
ncbi:MAG: hypothetical protein ACM3JD_13870 [Rudaea sp.]